MTEEEIDAAKIIRQVRERIQKSAGEELTQEQRKEAWKQYVAEEAEKHKQKEQQQKSVISEPKKKRYSWKKYR